MDKPGASADRPITHADIVRLLPGTTDAKAAALEAAGATLSQLEEAIAWATGESDVMGGELERPLDGRVARLYDILITEQADEDDRG